MGIKSKVLGATCTIAIVGTGLIGITYANEKSEFVKNIKGKFQDCLFMTDFSKYENLTDSQKDELTELQVQLKEIMEQEKNIRADMEKILDEAGVEIKGNNKMGMKPREVKFGEMKPKEIKELTDEEISELKEKKELTDEEIEKLKEKFSFSEEKKPELKSNKEFTNGRKGKMFENKTIEKN